MRGRCTGLPPQTDFECYWDKIYCINLPSRVDKWRECEAEFRKYGLTQVERSDGVPWKEAGHINALGGCVTAHLNVFKKIVANNFQRTLILEDDFEIIHKDFHKRWEEIIEEVPEQWDMLYLGGHYAEPPKYRVSEHIIRIGRMMTTSSYAINYKTAEELIPLFTNSSKPGSSDAADNLLYGTHLEKLCFITTPRLMSQRPGLSDIQHRHMNNRQCMSDSIHERMV